MTTTSVPIVFVAGGPDANLSHARWRGLFSDVADGIVGAVGTAGDSAAPAGASGGDLRLTLSSTDNTATIGLGRIRYRGFELEVTAPHGLTLPAATSAPITYTLGVVYDPAKESDALGPLALAPSASVPTGGSFLTLYQVTRQVGQVLSQATVADFRTFAGPSLVTLPGATKPTIGVPIGAHLWDGSDVWAMTHNAARTGKQWTNLTSPAWNTLALAGNNFTAQSPVPAWRVRGGRLEFSGAAVRTGGGTFGAGWATLGTVSGAAIHPGGLLRVGGLAVDTAAAAIVELWGATSAQPGRVDIRFWEAGASGVNLSGVSAAIR